MAKGNFSNALSKSLEGRSVNAGKGIEKEIGENQVKTEPISEQKVEEKIDNHIEPEKKESEESSSNISNNPKSTTKSKEIHKTTPTSSKSENKVKIVLSKKKAKTKTNHSFYIQDEHFQMLSKLAKENNLSISEVLDEILSQVL